MDSSVATRYLGESGYLGWVGGYRKLGLRGGQLFFHNVEVHLRFESERRRARLMQATSFAEKMDVCGEVRVLVVESAEESAALEEVNRMFDEVSAVSKSPTD